MADGTERTELVLVHGTWSNRQIWTTPFTRELERLIGGEVSRHAFDWTGRNTVRGRHDATLALIDFVRARAEDDRAARRVVIAHSHGGSVVMQAVARADLPIDAIVCIGTPFLHVSRFEEVVPGVGLPFAPLTAALGVLALGLTFRIMGLIGVIGLMAGVDWLFHHLLLSVAWFFVGFFLLGVFVIVMLIREGNEDRRLGRAGFEETSEWVDRLLTERDDAVSRLKELCRLPRVERVPTLLIKTPGDEAHAGLALAHLLSLGLRAIYNLPFRVLGRWIPSDFGDLPLADTVVGLVCAAVVFAWRAFASIPLLLLGGLCSLAFGIEFAKVTGRVVVAAGDTPPGKWNVVYLPPFEREEERKTRAAAYLAAGRVDADGEVRAMEATLEKEWDYATRGMAHSRPYNDPRAARLIAEWLGALPADSMASLGANRSSPD